MPRGGRQARNVPGRSVTGPLHDVLAAMRRVLDDAPVAGLLRARDELEQIAVGVSDLTAGTSRSEPGEILAAIGEACEQIDIALRECDTAAQNLTTYLASVQPGSAPQPTTSPTGGTGPETAPPSPQPYVRRELAAPQDPSLAFNPAAYFKDMPTFVAKRGHRTKTHGRWAIDADTTMDLVSGRDEYADRNDQRWPRIKRPSEPAPISAAADVELKFATYMNDHEIDQATIVINNPKGPCAGIVGCDEQLERFLGAGREMTVVWPGGSKTYTGGGAKP